MRMLMLYILFKEGILEEDLQILLRHAGLDSRSYELPLRNLDLLGPFRITKSFAEHKSASKSRKRPKVSSSDEESYELSRFVPPIKTVLEDLINGTLDAQTWASTTDQPPETQPTGQQGSLRTYFGDFEALLIIDNDQRGLREGNRLLRNKDNELLCSFLVGPRIPNHDPVMKFPRNGIGM
jgi:Sec1 family